MKVLIWCSSLDIDFTTHLPLGMWLHSEPMLCCVFKSLNLGLSSMSLLTIGGSYCNLCRLHIFSVSLPVCTFYLIYIYIYIYIYMGLRAVFVLHRSVGNLVCNHYPETMEQHYGMSLDDKGPISYCYNEMHVRNLSSIGWGLQCCKWSCSTDWTGIPRISNFSCSDMFLPSSQQC